MNKPTKRKILIWGMKNHSGTGMYLLLFFGFIIAGAMNDDIIWYNGMAISAGISAAWLIPLFLFTSYTGGKANLRHIK